MHKKRTLLTFKLYKEHRNETMNEINCAPLKRPCVKVCFKRNARQRKLYIYKNEWIHCSLFFIKIIIIFGYLTLEFLLSNDF